NRANWACYDLYRAGLLERPKKGLYHITDLGRKVAAEKPAKIDREYLLRFPSFVEFLNKTSAPPESVGPSGVGGELVANPALSTKTPEEQMEALATSLKNNLATEL